MPAHGPGGDGGGRLRSQMFLSRTSIMTGNNVPSLTKGKSIASTPAADARLE